MEQQQQPAAAEDGQQPLSFARKMRNGERYWAYKMGLRITLCIAMLIGIGTSAWLVATAFGSQSYFGYLHGMDTIIMPFVLAVICLSLIWTLITILVPLLRRTHRPVHPGTAVSFELLLWLALLTTGLFTIVCIYQLDSFGSYGRIDDGDYSSDYSGYYRQASNGTWVYKIDWVSDSYGDPKYHYNETTGDYTYGPRPTKADVKRVCGPQSCAEEDAEINKLWQQKQQRETVDIVVAAVQFLGVLLHFVLFVWACVDTHRRNTTGKEAVMRRAADEALRDMQARGLITIHDPAMAGRAGGGAELRPLMEGEAGPSAGREQAPG
ncbi:uncharacterized protein LTR77_000806 [Saxophila tyrrhenica]|uniref:Tetraspanin n=1 Tax=Saxophila tyrrhenica TaxID=1690608 RepID=A0AAV9PPE1_9PEZI|nr:hypothetical protein LTR77_000806 [Saxophila tyrrhenica]